MVVLFVRSSDISEIRKVYEYVRPQRSQIIRRPIKLSKSFSFSFHPSTCTIHTQNPTCLQRISLHSLLGLLTLLLLRLLTTFCESSPTPLATSLLHRFTSSPSQSKSLERLSSLQTKGLKLSTVFLFEFRWLRGQQGTRDLLSTT